MYYIDTDLYLFKSYLKCMNTLIEGKFYLITP